MKYHRLLLLAFFVFLSGQASAQDNPFVKGGQGSGKFQSLEGCPDFKIGIFTPPAGTHYKMQLLVPPQNLDPGIVSRLCDTPDQLSVVSQMLMPPSGQNVWSTDGVFMSGQGNVFFTGQGSTFALGKPK